MSTSASRPGIARADRRELRLLGDWFSAPRLREVDEDFDAFFEAHEAGDEEAAIAVMQRMMPPRRTAWRAFRAPKFYCFRTTDSQGRLEFQVHDDTSDIVVNRSGSDSDSPDELPMELRFAVDSVASRVLAWLRRDGAPPEVASRLATLFAI